MIDDKYKKIISEGKGFAVVMAGSDSDAPHIDKIVKSLGNYEVPYQVRIGSVHKQPEWVESLIKKYNDINGLICYIAIAGGTDALSGLLSFHALGPVISCPPDTKYADKEKYPNRFNESCLTNPPGSSNAYVARPENVGRLVAQIFSGVNPRFRELLQQEISAKIELLKEADRKFQLKYGGK